ncbi:MAG: enoyl-CoA hydratase-related protein, partial [Myxococcota bacterium]
METLRLETAEGVREIVLCRAAAYNTITPALRDELAAAIDAADADREVRVILLRAEGPAFCAGYALDWGTAMQAREQVARSEPRASEGHRDGAQRGEAERSPEGGQRVWDSV